MPNQYWEFECCSPSGRWRQSRPTCSSCGAEGDYCGWQISGREKLFAFARLTGMTPFGPERMSPRGRALTARLVRCPLCAGRGVLEDPTHSELWAYCPDCLGNGAALDGNFEEVPDPRWDSLNGILYLGRSREPDAGEGDFPSEGEDPGLER